jgi:cytochrome c biogenesis protein CcmG/thiol:disulfide interchange protein DsbE
MARRGKLILQMAAVSVVALLISLFAWQLATKEQARGLTSALERGETPPAPAFTLARLAGEGEISLASLRGKAVVLNFWASWCEPCKEESPRLESAWRRYRDQDVVFVGIDVNDFKGDARKFVERYGLTYPILHDGQGSTIGRYGVTGFPETWFVGRNGNLVGARVQGPVNDSELNEYIRRALAES